MELFTKKIFTKLSKIWVWDPGSREDLFRIRNTAERTVSSASMMLGEKGPRGPLWSHTTEDAPRVPRRRRTRSEDPLSGGGSGLVQDTLAKIRRSGQRHSTSARLSNAEIDQLIMSLRRQNEGRTLYIIIRRIIIIIVLISDVPWSVAHLANF